MLYVPCVNILTIITGYVSHISDYMKATEQSVIDVIQISFLRENGCACWPYMLHILHPVYSMALFAILHDLNS